MDILIGINVLSRDRVNTTTLYVKDIFSNMVKAGYCKRRPSGTDQKVVELDPSFSRYYAEKILKDMLRTCKRDLIAGSGSVTMLDRGMGAPCKKAGAKPNGSTVSNTVVKSGDGMAGLVAATSKPIILPKDQNGKGTPRKVKQSDSRFPMVVPFYKDINNEVYGVISFNIIRKNLAFSKKDISVVKELVDMASNALTPLYRQHFAEDHPPKAE